MELVSTRGGATFRPLDAVLCGLAPDGGLFVPRTIPRFSDDEIRAMAEKPYVEISAAVIHAFFDSIEETDCLSMAKTAYQSFSAPDVLPLERVNEQLHLLDLDRGPTLAFKDVALQMLPLLMGKAQDGKRRTLILVATSGDTGKAALTGFGDKPDTAIFVFYPEKGVSPAQKRQMQTAAGKNVAVFGVQGDFDDCQRGVKALMGDLSFQEAVAAAGYEISSANSINIGRLVPQIAYYFYSYAQLCRRGTLVFGQPLNFVVPTGNFGNILAGWYAKHMGLPVGKLVGASNRNNVLFTFVKTGTYQAGLTLHQTASPSMDILVSSNLERLLYHLSGEDSELVRMWMEQQKRGESFTVTPGVMEKLQDEFCWGWADDEMAKQTIGRVFDQSGCLLDPHSAVAESVYESMVAMGELSGQTVVLCTASPYKFAASVLRALGVTPQGDGCDGMLLSEASGSTVPDAIESLWTLPVLHQQVIDPSRMREAVLNTLTDSGFGC